MRGTLFTFSAILFILLWGSNPAFGQNDKVNIIQFSGFVMTSDSLMGLPYCNIIIKNTNRGTISAFDGYFSIVAAEGDSIVFSSVGFKRETYVIPTDLENKKYSIIQLLTADTIYLSETLIYPWPSKDEFRQAFLNLDLPDDDLERARKNLERERLRELGEAMAMDGKEATDYYIRKQAEAFTYQNQLPPMNIFNPFAWAQFIEAWKNGDFKREK